MVFGAAVVVEMIIIDSASENRGSGRSVNDDSNGDGGLVVVMKVKVEVVACMVSY